MSALDRRDTVYTHSPEGPLPSMALGTEQTLLEALRMALEELEAERAMRLLYDQHIAGGHPGHPSTCVWVRCGVTRG